MELSQQQIQSIDKRLEKNGIKYWDIRLEMVDHLVSDIEVKLARGESYESAVENAFQQMNWNGNLSSLNRAKLLTINKIVKKQFFRQVTGIFRNMGSLFVLSIFLTLYSLLFLKTSFSVFKYSTLVILIVPLLIGLFFHVKEFFVKNKSGYLIYSSFYIFFVFFLLNMFLQFFQPKGIFPVSEEIQKMIWFLVTITNSICATAGLMVHYKTMRKIKKIAT